MLAISDNITSFSYQCGVHIADVTHFVRPGTHLDDEAVKRGTTVYLVDQVRLFFAIGNNSAGDLLCELV